MIDDHLERQAPRRFWVRIWRVGIIGGGALLAYGAGFFEKTLPHLRARLPRRDRERGVQVIAAEREAPAQAAGPPVAPGDITGVPAIFAQGPRETVDMLRELRDLGRRGVEEIDRIADDVRAIRDGGRRRNEILVRIEREQAIANDRRRERGA